MSDGPLSTPRYSSARERALAETLIDWTNDELWQPPGFSQAELDARRTFCEGPRSGPTSRASFRSEARKWMARRPREPGILAGLAAAGAGATFAALGCWVYTQPMSAPLSAFALAAAGACLAYLVLLLFRWR